MSEITVTQPFIDWITVTVPPLKMTSFIRKFLFYEVTESIRPAYHQSAAVLYYPSEIRHYFSPDAKDKDSVLVMDGTALNNIRREHGHEWTMKYCGIVAKTALKMTRVDLSLDIMDSGLTAHEVAKLTLGKKIDYGRRKAHARIEQEEKDGCTTYAGVRTSPKIMRIYDKNATSKGENPSTRIEFELKDHASAIVGESMAGYHGYRHVPALFTGLLNEFADWSNVPTIESLTYGDVLTIPPATREPLLSKKQWLERQIAPTFLNHASGKDLWDWFKDYIETSMQSTRDE